MAAPNKVLQSLAVAALLGLLHAPAQAASRSLAMTEAQQEAGRTAEQQRDRYPPTDGRCIQVAIEDGLGWQRNRGWGREAFCIDRGFDGVIRDKADDQSGICYKGTCD